MAEDKSKLIQELMNKPDHIRNIGIAAHIDHGKTTLTDSLLAGAGMLSEEVAASANQEDGKQDPIAWYISGRAAEDPSGIGYNGENSWRTVTVQEGDTLRKLALEVYGRIDDTTLDRLKEKNPAIYDVNLIIVGQRIAFPPFSELGKKSASLQ